MFSHIVNLVRVKHWIKNLLVLAPAFFAQSLTNAAILELTFAFFSFSLMASAVYVINDLSDKEQDQLDIRKKNRPLASGSISVHVARLLIIVLILASCLLALSLTYEVLYLVLVYLFLNILYSWKLKHVSLIDLLIVASGYVIRIFLGAIVVGVTISNWMLVLTFLFALFLAIGRRSMNMDNNELIKARGAYSGYNAQFITHVQVYLTSIITIAYIMYSISPEVSLRVQTNHLYLTSLPVIIGFLRYFQIHLVEGSSIEPIQLITKDRVIIGAIIVWLALFTYFLYF